MPLLPFVMTAVLGLVAPSTPSDPAPLFPVTTPSALLWSGSPLDAALQVPDTLNAAAQIQGRRDAEEVSTRDVFVRGVAWGLVTGPVGGIIAMRRASNLGVPDPPRPAAQMSQMGPGYREAYLEGYNTGVEDRRNEAAVMGSLVGTIGFGALVLTLMNWGGDPVFIPPPQEGFLAPEGFRGIPIFRIGL